MPLCEYLISANNPKEGSNPNLIIKLKTCDKEGRYIFLPDLKFVKKYFGRKKHVCLCEEHKEFVMDSIQPIEKSETKMKGFKLL